MHFGIDTEFTTRLAVTDTVKCRACHPPVLAGPLAEELQLENPARHPTPTGRLSRSHADDGAGCFLTAIGVAGLK